jgi:hypothetical protein
MPKSHRRTAKTSAPTNHAERPAGKLPDNRCEIDEEVQIGIDLRSPARGRAPSPGHPYIESAPGRCRSLIPGLGVKLSVIVLAEPLVLSAVEA